LHRVVLSLGANLGSPLNTLKKALNKLSLLGEGFVVSKFYQNPPVSPLLQPDFINCACLFYTRVPFNQLIPIIEAVEIKFGKIPKPKSAPRVLDIDLIFFGERSFAELGWEVPHPEWSNRLFVLVPLADLLDEIVLEGKTLNIRELIARFPLHEIEKMKVCL
jgi:2-amino-4-hydroxy-6-hydroxymethyldihydropteridine diphosphokinase